MKTPFQLACLLLFICLPLLLGAVSFYDQNVEIANMTVDDLHNLLQQGANINEPDSAGYTPLMNATIQNYSLVPAMLAAGADVNATANDGISVLMYALNGWTDPNVVTALVQAGANLNAVDKQNWTPLHYALFKNYPVEVIAQVISPQNINSPDKNGYTPLMTAMMWKGAPDVVSMLIRRGAKVNMAAEGGSTALMIAGRNVNNEQVIDILLSAGADKNAKDLLGKTAYDYADMNAALSQSPVRNKLKP